MAQLLEQIKELPRDEQWALFREITPLLQEEEALSPASQAEMQRRLHAAERENFVGEDWQSVKAQILAGTALDCSRF